MTSHQISSTALRSSPNRPSENARKAEETSKVQAATHTWQRWVWGAMALVAVAFIARSVIRRRG